MRSAACEPSQQHALRELDSPCKLADSDRRIEFMHPTPLHYIPTGLLDEHMNPHHEIELGQRGARKFDGIATEG
jgi:hypothetical protein